MKRFYKSLKYLIFGLLILIVTASIGLLTFYNSIYKATPLPSKSASAPALKFASVASNQPVLLPVPKKLIQNAGFFKLKEPIQFFAPEKDIECIKNFSQNLLGAQSESSKVASIRFLKDSNLPEQAYHLTIQPSQVIISYNSRAGLFYAFATLKQLAEQFAHDLPCLKIEDEPDLKVRGVMLDISRGKVPKLETLYGMVDFLANLKYNQLQLYVEGFSFGYPSFKNLWEKTETPLLPEEIRQLDAYCKERCIELVPNQNMLGHMDAWLKTDQYKDLAECPDGFKLLGLIEMKSTIAPGDPRSLELVKKMSEDLLPNFQSSQFNVNLDEPFELGKSKKHPVSDPKEIAGIYLDYAKKLNDFAKSKGKKMMMWGDVVSRSPEIIPEIPKDITLLEWRYESLQSFRKISEQYQQAGLQYMVCPGTSTWSSFTGRTDNMLANIEDAVSSATRFGAKGMLITDWGDTPHLQCLTVSYPALAYAAALSWNNLKREDVPLTSYLSKTIFRDSKGIMGKLVMELGRYNQFEEYPMVAMTTTSMAFRFGLMDKMMLNAIDTKLHKGLFDLMTLDPEVKNSLSDNFANPKIYNPAAILNFTDSLNLVLTKTHLNLPDSSRIRDEYANAIRMISLGAMLKQYNNYHLQQTKEENQKLLGEMNSLCNIILKEHDRLWMSRNKSGGLEASKESFLKLQVQVKDQLELLKKNSITRYLSRIVQKIVTAAAVMYLRMN